MYFELKSGSDLSNECCICQDDDLVSIEQFNLQMSTDSTGLILKNNKHKNIGEALFRLSNAICFLDILCTLETNQGHGSLLLKELIKYCKSLKIKEIRCNSTDEAESFYLKHKFKKVTTINSTTYDETFILKL